MFAATYSQTRRLASSACRQSGQRRLASGNVVPPHSEYRFRSSIERGRRQYTVRNMLTAAGLTGGVAGIYFYSLHAVKQEDYSDIPMPAVLSEDEKA
ncbi:hypothetical protein IWW50_002131, partial [Coemansia erecta]